jgi:GNAT superfamily N-acetyltransferase
MAPSPYDLRPAGPDDEPFLWAMLYEAAHAAEDGTASPDDLKAVPELAHYVAGFGRPGDLGVIGTVGGTPQGAAWLRLFPADDPAYGWVDAATPELAIGVAPAARGSGLGTALLARLLADAREQGTAAVSLSVRESNPARRLYERLGFVPVDGDPVPDRTGGGHSITMVMPLA